MFEAQHRDTNFRSALALIELIYVSTVRNIRRTHRSPVMGLLSNMMQAVMFLAAFYLMSVFMGFRSAALRGDFILYLLSGIFLFMTHTKAISAIMSSDGPTSPMMQHAPMNTAISISSSALSALYLQTLSVCIILFVVHVVWKPVEIYDPVGVLGMFVLAWFSGVGVGMVLLAIKPWFPGFAALLSSIYRRANMIASGKMFVANALPSSMLAFFDWNPLFHCIDQARGYMFINYYPHFTSARYALWVSAVLIVIGLMGEFYTRKHASASWSAGR